MPASTAESIRKYNLISQNHGHLPDTSHRSGGNHVGFVLGRNRTKHKQASSCQKIASLIQSLEWKIWANRYSMALKHLRHCVHSACSTSEPRVQWVHLKMTCGDTEFYQSMGHSVNWQGWSLGSTLHSSEAARPLEQHPKKHFKWARVTKLLAYSSHDNRELLLTCTCLLHSQCSWRGKGKPFHTAKYCKPYWAQKISGELPTACRVTAS